MNNQGKYIREERKASVITACQSIAKPVFVHGIYCSQLTTVYFINSISIVDADLLERETLGSLNPHSCGCSCLRGAAHQRVSLIMHRTLFLAIGKDFVFYN